MNSRVLVAVALALAVVLALMLAGGDGVSGDQIASLAYGGLLITLVSGWAFAMFRANLSESIRNLMIWGALFAVIAFLYASKAQFGF